jgi:hypothetical protein
VVGVPDITPVDVLRASPGGRLPVEMDQVIGASPPEEVKGVVGYAVPAVAPGSWGGLIDNGAGGATRMTSGWVTVAGTASESVIPTVRLNEPSDWGTPVIAPKASRLRPAGSEPLIRVHE